MGEIFEFFSQPCAWVIRLVLLTTPIMVFSPRQDMNSSTVLWHVVCCVIYLCPTAHKPKFHQTAQQLHICPSLSPHLYQDWHWFGFTDRCSAQEKGIFELWFIIDMYVCDKHCTSLRRLCPLLHPWETQRHHPGFCVLFLSELLVGVSLVLSQGLSLV